MNKDFIFGIQPVLEAIHSGKEIDKILLQNTMNPAGAREIFDACRVRNIPIQKAPIEKLNRVTRKNHQGIIAFVSAVAFSSLDGIITECFSAGKEPFILMLDRITDVRNFGAIVRTAEGAGVDAIVIPDKGGAALNADAMKTSAGALNYVPICRSHSLKDALVDLKNSGLSVVGMTEKASDGLYDANLSGPMVVLMGSEEDGISTDLLRICDYLVKIPMFGSINSLNVSVSAALGLYEVIRQRIITK